LKRRAESLVASSQTAVERGHARLLLTRLTQFEEIKARHSALHRPVAVGSGADTVRDASSYLPAYAGCQPIPGAVATQQPGAVDSPVATATSADPGAADASRFDGTGRLAAVLSQRVGAPPYALLDEAGGIAMYVSGAPGTSLRQFVGRRVGIVGVRGFHPQLNTTHLMARQVTVLR
jgi:hypothetical protein